MTPLVCHNLEKDNNTILKRPPDLETPLIFKGSLYFLILEYISSNEKHHMKRPFGTYSFFSLAYTDILKIIKINM